MARQKQENQGGGRKGNQPRERQPGESGPQQRQPQMQQGGEQKQQQPERQMQQEGARREQHGASQERQEQGRPHDKPTTDTERREHDAPRRQNQNER